MLATEIRNFYKMEVRVKATSIILNNIEVNFNSLTLYSEYEDKDVVVKDRRCVTEVSRTTDGIRVQLFILNEGVPEKEKLDYLFDEEYQVEAMDLVIRDTKTNKEYEYVINEQVGEAVSKEVEIEIQEDMRNALNLLNFGEDSEEEQKTMMNIFYNILDGNQEAIDKLNDISKISIL